MRGGGQRARVGFFESSAWGPRLGRQAGLGDGRFEGSGGFAEQVLAEERPQELPDQLHPAEVTSRVLALERSNHEWVVAEGGVAGALEGDAVAAAGGCRRNSDCAPARGLPRSSPPRGPQGRPTARHPSVALEMCLECAGDEWTWACGRAGGEQRAALFCGGDRQRVRRRGHGLPAGAGPGGPGGARLGRAAHRPPRARPPFQPRGLPPPAAARLPDRRPRRA